LIHIQSFVVTALKNQRYPNPHSQFVRLLNPESHAIQSTGATVVHRARVRVP